MRSANTFLGGEKKPLVNFDMNLVTTEPVQKNQSETRNSLCGGGASAIKDYSIHAKPKLLGYGIVVSVGDLRALLCVCQEKHDSKQGIICHKLVDLSLLRATEGNTHNVYSDNENDIC